MADDASGLRRIRPVSYQERDSRFRTVNDATSLVRRCVTLHRTYLVARVTMIKCAPEGGLLACQINHITEALAGQDSRVHTCEFRPRNELGRFEVPGYV